jgi:ABC-type branched-subunit amino acid transport system ATPase component
MLELDRICSCRGKAEVLRGITLSVKEKEVVCLVGRNGAGKTSMAETIMGHLPATAGKMTWAGRDVTRLPPYRRARRGIGYAPDYCGIFPDLTVDENLEISELVVGGSKEQKAEKREQIYSVFPEIREFGSRRGLNLSGGQKKMVAISRAMTLSPALLLLDEAFEGLAPVVVSRFTEAVIKIKKLGISLLIAESNLTAASKIADRIYAIDRGEIIFEGTPQDIVKDNTVMRTIFG